MFALAFKEIGDALFMISGVRFRRLILGPRLAAPQLIEANVGDDPVKPGVEAALETEAVQIAGGTTTMSKSSQVVLFRRVNDDLVKTQLLDLKKMMKGKGNQLNEDAHLQAGDLVYVPQNAISKIAPYLTRPSMGMYVSPTQF